MKANLVTYLFFILISAWQRQPHAASANSLTIYTLYPKENVGDAHQVSGVITALSKLSHQPIATHRFYSHEQEQLLKTLLATSAPQSILLAVGAEGIMVIENLNNICAREKKGCQVIKCHLSHQYTELHPRLLGKVDMCALPSHAIPPSFPEECAKTKTSLVSTLGVAHDLSEKDIKKAYNTFKHEIPPASAYISVILGGDAPDAAGGMHYFTKKDAKNLVGNVIALSQHYKDAHLLILNGPRTGKHNPKTGMKNEKAHYSKTDAVTAYFMTKLTEKISSTRVTLFDFRYGAPSMFAPVLGAISENGGVILVPGESTSMISEAIDTLPGRVLIYLNSAMNTSHRAHVEQEVKTSRAKLVDQNILSTLTNTPTSSAPQKSAAETIAQGILSLLATK